jgi:hypothetical protein
MYSSVISKEHVMAAAKPKKTYKSPKSFTVKKKAKQAKQVLLAVLVGGVLLGGLALAFANTRKSQDVRSDASGGTRVCAVTIRNKDCARKGNDSPSRSVTTSAFVNTANLPSKNCEDTDLNAWATGVPEKIVVATVNLGNQQAEHWPNGVLSWSRSCWIEPNFVPEPTSAGSTPVSGSDDEKIIIGGTIYACDGSRLANVPVRAYGNTVTTNAQGKWQVTKNTSVIANGIQEFTVVAGNDVTSTHATTYTPRSAAPQFAKVNAGCGKIACDYKPSATSNSRGYSVNKYQFGTDLATYRKWFVTSTTAPNPLLGFDFKPVNCAPAASANITVTAQPATGGGVTVNARITPKAGLSVSKAQFAYRKKGATAWEASKLKNETTPNNGVYSATYALGERVGTPGEYEFTVNVYFADGTTPCTGNGSYVGPWFTQCSGQKSAFLNWSTPSPND